jgi:membrane fusion protein (multidrug efflux system)
MAILVGKGMVAQADFDKAEADLQQLMAQADNIRAAIAKKTIRAPFAGRLGIRLINLGEVVQEGDAIVSLQILDPIFVNFQLPQQELARISTGLTVALSGEALDERQIRGKITTISPEIDTVTRNVLVQATVANHEEVLRPGMFVNLSIILPGENRVLTVPATAVHYAPYGDSCFVVEEKKDEKSGAASLVLRQQFVRLGEKRGDFVAIREGLSEAETVVSVGVFKLRNGQAVVIDNSTAPEFKLEPRPENN